MGGGEVYRNERFPLAILTTRLGSCSQTFIRRHAYELMPGQTAMVASFEDPQDQCWTAPGPYLVRGQKRAYTMRRLLLRRLPRSAKSIREWVADSGNWDKRVGEFFESKGVAVVLGEFLDASHPYLKVAQALGMRFYVHAHGYDVSKSLRSPEWRRKYLDFNSASGVITMSRLSKRRLVDIGLRPEKIHVVPYGVAVPRSFPQGRERSSGGIRCVAVGRMVPKKAPLLLLESFQLAARKRTDLALDYIGGGPLLKQAKEYVSRNGLGDRVKLYGAAYPDQVRKAMAGADIFIQHSIVDPRTGDEEGLPVAVLEAMAQGLPVVSTRHSAIPEEVDEGVTGYLVEEGATQHMAECIDRLADDSKLRKTLGRAGWERARSHFTLEDELTRLREILGLEVSTGKEAC